MKTGSKCSKEKGILEFYRNKGNRSGYASWCKACEAIGAKIRYQRRRAGAGKVPGEKIASYPDKLSSIHNFVSSRVQCALERGTMIRPKTCSSCGKGGEIRAHHPSYLKPYDVVWLCIPCHIAEHKRIRKEGIDLMKNTGENNLNNYLDI